MIAKHPRSRTAILILLFCTAVLCFLLKSPCVKAVEYPRQRTYRLGVDTADGWSSLNVWHHGPGCVKCAGLAKYKVQVKKKQWQSRSVSVSNSPACDENTEILCRLGKAGTFKDLDWAGVSCRESNQLPREAHSQQKTVPKMQTIKQQALRSRHTYQAMTRKQIH